ncbi:hypothetical protein [Natrinema caseinilyticum]|uniref:hypothetical protein n=1 Tax=Natrinema caseinilyticum TaxID=2961570 RepID=UPI0020C3DCBA|nr:hypothetical protein [Natrinema caseinilyticum]
MSDRQRRSVLASGATLLTGGLFVSGGAVGTAETNEQRPAETTESDLELEVDVTETRHISPSADRFEFDVCVRNTGDEPVSVPITLEMAHIDEEVDVFEIDPNDSESDNIGHVHPTSLGPGEYDWTITAGEATETGTVLVTADDDYEDRDGGFYLSLFDHPEGQEIVKTTSGCGDEPTFAFTIDVASYHYESVEEELVYEVEGEAGVVDDETGSWGTIEFEPRGFTGTYHIFSLPVGEYEWTASIGDDSISRRLRVVPGDAKDCCEPVEEQPAEEDEAKEQEPAEDGAEEQESEKEELEGC